MPRQPDVSKDKKPFRITIPRSAFDLTPVQIAEIESIDDWLKSSKKRLGPTIFGEPTHRSEE